MKVIQTPLDGLLLIQLDIYKDERGFFVERFNKNKFVENGLPVDFVQDNHSRSMPGVIRGLHWQENPSQGKLVGVVKGRILDVAVDVRKDSSTYGQYFSVELNDNNGKLLWIPSGFAHGFCVLGEDEVDVFYKTDQFYNPAGEKGIRFDDKDIGVDWPVTNPIISGKDKELPYFKDL